MEDVEEHQALTQQTFIAWLETAASSEAAGSDGFAIGRDVRRMLVERHEATQRQEEPGDAEKGVSQPPGAPLSWFQLLRVVAEATSCSAFRCAAAVTTTELAVALDFLGYAPLPRTDADTSVRQVAKQLSVAEWPEKLAAAVGEIVLIRCAAGELEELPVEVGGVDIPPADGDEPERIATVEELNAGGQAAAKDYGTLGAAAKRAVRQAAPRIDPPALDLAPCREDEAGYIPKAFPKLFPHGTGDYHDARGGDGRSKKLDFVLWVRLVAGLIVWRSPATARSQ